jgi:hypothetical protein
MSAELRINPLALGPFMGTLTEMVHRFKYSQGFSLERTESFAQTILLGWVIKKIKYNDNDWSMEGPVGVANADWIIRCSDEAIAAAEAVQTEIDRKSSDEQ